MRFSVFNVYVVENDSVLIKNMLTGSIIRTPRKLFDSAEMCPISLETVFQQYGADISKFYNNGLVVDNSRDELKLWQDDLIQTRDEKAHLFILHFLPTIQCQLCCSYCFEKGLNRGRSMRKEVIENAIKWLDCYLEANQEVDQLRMVLFGGEPLLCPEICFSGLEKVSKLCLSRGIEFWTEIVTNGELLTEEVAMKLSLFNWQRVQITLDGPAQMHDVRRPGAHGRKTHKRIVENVCMLLSTSYIPTVDLRLSFDLKNCDSVISYLEEIQTFGDINRIQLSLGFIADTFESVGDKNNVRVAEKAVEFWAKAKEMGFAIPETQFSGPLCVATAKHSVVLLPDGSLQKCFATTGRGQYSFSTVLTLPKGYSKDPRFEQWSRMSQCISEKCSYLPVCGAGCIYDAMVASGGPDGSMNRYCQKEFLDSLNKGLIAIEFSKG